MLEELALIIYIFFFFFSESMEEDGAPSVSWMVAGSALSPSAALTPCHLGSNSFLPSWGSRCDGGDPGLRAIEGSPFLSFLPVLVTGP